MRKYLRNQMRCAARAAGVKPSKHVAYAWDEWQVHKYGATARKINKARGTHPKRRWKNRVQSAFG